MARGVNKVIIVGNLGDDPETRYTNSGTAITTISVATSEQWKDKDDNKQERTEWHRIKFFGRLAEIAGEYLKKGRQVYVEGKLQTDKYEDKEGIERYSTWIIANDMQMIGGGDSQKREGQQQGHQSRAQDQVEQRQRGGNTNARERARQAADAGAQDRPPPKQDDALDDDDIPF